MALNRGPWTEQEDVALVRKLAHRCEPSAFPDDVWNPEERHELGASLPDRRPIADVKQRCHQIQEVIVKKKGDRALPQAPASTSTGQTVPSAQPVAEQPNTSFSSTSQKRSDTTAAMNKTKASENVQPASQQRSSAEQESKPTEGGDKIQQPQQTEKSVITEETPAEQESDGMAAGQPAQRADAADGSEEGGGDASSKESTRSKRSRSSDSSKKERRTKRRKQQSSMVIEGDFEALQVERAGRDPRSSPSKARAR